MNRWLFVVLGMLVAGGVAVFMGESSEDVSLNSVAEIWSDVARDVDQFGLRVTRVSDEEEMQLGREIAGWFAGEVHEADPRSEYVRCVGQQLTTHVRRPGIQYEFHVVSATYPNAFAIPGGQVYITDSLLDAMESEAELATVLGHEISHIDARHCIENFQYAIAMEKIGMDRLAENMLLIVRHVVMVGNSQYQELEADAQGLRLAAQAGYSPHAGVEVFSRVFFDWEEPSRREARQPLGEVAGAINDALRDRWRSHPYTEDRIWRLRQLADRYESKLGDRELYVGKENFRLRRCERDPPLAVQQPPSHESGAADTPP